MKNVVDIIKEEINQFAFGKIPEKETSTFMKLLNTAERDGYFTGMEKSATYIMDAARKVADEFDKLHPEEKKVFRDAYYDKFLKIIHKK